VVIPFDSNESLSDHLDRLPLDFRAHQVARIERSENPAGGDIGRNIEARFRFRLRASRSGATKAAP
jgi:hypothetical protein